MSHHAASRRFLYRVLTCAALSFALGGLPRLVRAEDARTHFDQGIKEYKTNHLDAALAEFQKAHELAPKEPTSLFWIGFLYLQQRRYQDALQPTLDGLALRPKFADGHLNLGNIYDGLKRYPEAITEFEAAVKLEPNMPRLADAYYNMGSVQLKLNHKVEAIEAFQKAATAAPKDGYIQDGLGYAYQVTGNYEKAVIAHQAATRIAATNANFWLNLGLAQQSLARKQRQANSPALGATQAAAADAFAQAVKLAPNDYAARESYGEALYELRDNAKAVVQFKKAIELNPKDDRPLYNLALTQTRLGNREATAEAYRRVLQINPNNIDALQGLGTAQFQLKQYVDAAQTYQKLTTLTPTNVAVWTNYSLALQNQGKSDEAAQALEEAFKHVGMGKETLPLRLGLASFYYQRGGGDSLPRARELYQQILKDNPNSAEAYNGLGLVAQKEAKYDDAIAAFKRAVILKPDYDDAYNNLGAACEAKNDKPQAIANYRKALEINPNNALAKDSLARITKGAAPK